MDTEPEERGHPRHEGFDMPPFGLAAATGVLPVESAAVTRPTGSPQLVRGRAAQ